MAKKNGMLFMECSAKSGQNVDALFLVLTEGIKNKIEKGEIDPNNQSIGIKIGPLETEKEISKKK
jgi:Ras-related protein Rab-2A